MKILMDILNANTLADLPPVCRGFWEDDEEFATLFATLPDYDKAETVKVCLLECLDNNIRDSHNTLRMLMYCIKGEQADYEDEDAPQEAVIPTVDAPVQQTGKELDRLQRKLDQATAEIDRLKADLKAMASAQIERPKPAPKNPEEKRGRGRPPKDAEGNAVRCELCNIGFSTFGSRYNHYGSKQHKEVCLSYLEKVKTFVSQDGIEDRNIKLRVEARSHLFDPELTTENPTAGDIDGILNYVRTETKNPIADLVCVEATHGTYSSGRHYLSWKECIDRK